MRQLCTAKTRVGEPCKAKAVTGKTKCRVHGGANPGPPVGNANSLKHGIYGAYLTDEEKEALPALETQLGKLDGEIALVRIRIQRTLKAEESAADNEQKGLELQKFHKREASEYTAGDEHVYERVDYNEHLNRLIARLESLTKTRAALIEAEGGAGGEDDHSKTDTFIAPDEPIPERPIL